ncbi:phosphocholine cytidylyltransferase family protein [Caldovatus aquaticus]|uniref:Phosphocholine cytidylyltransferase family protein n=1 Tax=Caldovatus aquaticus TaxID=2865671 RepID=A0ABS7F6X5_9PROT|nr:phosphocholine cytidylyltransferase family protein [Caldovatus aquaticus]MBW8271376.1 phosphocholine cytidylyltransferase family protein [Caldovatus aquaticus]
MSQHRRPTAAVILAAGVGRRLGDAGDRPKVLLEFGGRTLLERHLAALRACGVEEVSITVGHRRELIEAEVTRLGERHRVHCVHNPRYREGSLVSLWAQSALLRAGRPLLLMDGDVLYDPRIVAQLLDAPGENVLLVDRAIEPGEEPVKVCFRGGRIVDFRKRPEHAHDWHGESVGFFRFSGAMAAALAERCDARLREGRTDLEYEEAIRDLILAAPERFGAADVTGLPWIEIDFAADVARARAEILPRLDGAAAGGAGAARAVAPGA